MKTDTHLIFSKIVSEKNNTRSMKDARRKVDYCICEYKGNVTNDEYRKSFEFKPGSMKSLPNIIHIGV